MAAVDKHVSQGEGKLDFPPAFKFGAASSSYQVEGAWNVADKSISVWDQFSHDNKVMDGSSGDVACDSYHLYKRDVDICKEMGLHFYRFSISWPRLLPNGFANQVSEDGKRYYNDLIDELLKNGIEPVVTLYHWDLPKRLQDLGGFANPLIVDWFGDYARIAYSLFGDRVKTWLTLNEIVAFADLGYGLGLVAPAIADYDASYIVTKNALLAHARAWRIYDEEFRREFHGLVSLTSQLIWFEPASDEDEEATNLFRDFASGRFCHPIFSKEGGWPPALEKRLAEASAKQGYPRSKLPAFTKEEKEYIRGTYDFFGLNHYTSRTIRKMQPGETVKLSLISGNPDLGAVVDVDPGWKKGAAFWFYVNPEGFRKTLNWIKQQYGDDIKVFIMENGYSDTENTREDDTRVEYYRSHLEQVLLSIKEDKVNVIGYTAWSLTDNFEWLEGYLSKFGLYEVDFSDPNRTRTPRKSAKFYAEVIKRHSLDFPASP